MEALKGLYHVDKQDEKSFIDNFTIRLKEFHLIIDNLLKQKKKPLQHFLITGKRGMGKSTLLRRIHIEASKSPLNEKLVAVRLGTEQYRLSRLFKLWEMVIEQLGNDDAALLEQKKELEKSKHYETALLPIINDYLKKTNRTLLLLIDNFDQFIDKIPAKDQHAFREALMVHPIQVIGNTVFYNEHFRSYNEPFFDFFKPIHLGNLDKEESEGFIRLRAENEGINDFDDIFKHHRGKINALRILSGGVPRTLLILLSIVSKKNTGDAVDYLHEMIEQVTPLYQDRMKALSSQQQEIMHHLAMHWDRTPVKDLAEEMRIPSKSISAQLIQLEKSGYIKKIDARGRNLYYEIDERFFNIWLLMSEAAPYDSKRVIWLTKWLDAFYSTEELKDFALFCQTMLKSIKPGNRFLIAQALSESERLEIGYKKQFINEIAEDLKDKIFDVKVWADNVNRKITETEILLKREIQGLIDSSRFDEALSKLDILEKIDEGSALFGKGYLYHKILDVEIAEKYYRRAIDKGDINAMANLGNLYENEKRDIAGAKKYYQMAIDKGHAGAMFNLGVLYDNAKDIDTAEKYYLMAVEKGDIYALLNLGYLYQFEKKDIVKAEKYYRLGVKNGDVEAMFNLGFLYESDKDDIVEGERYYRMAIKKNHVKAMTNLGILYQYNKKDIAVAEKYYLMAAEKDDSIAMFYLGGLYETYHKDIASAERYYRMAAEKEHVQAMGYLANIYFETNNVKQKKNALKFCSNAIEIQSNEVFFEALYIKILLWNEKIKDASQRMINILNNPLYIEDNVSNISGALQYFLVFRQKQFLYQQFNTNPELIDRYKPVYYALMHEMQDEHPKEYLKMTSELEEPVKAILDFVTNEQKRLGV